VVAGLIKSAGCQLVIRVLGRQAQMRAHVTRNKTARAVRPKADNIWQVGPGCYIWYQSQPH
jgi:hypothetical protein